MYVCMYVRTLAHHLPLTPRASVIKQHTRTIIYIFIGRDEVQQISLIFHLIGAPTTRIWPDIHQLPLIRDLKIDLMEVRYVHI